jgi:hypothetical protein
MSSGSKLYSQIVRVEAALPGSGRARSERPPVAQTIRGAATKAAARARSDEKA